MIKKKDCITLYFFKKNDIGLAMTSFVRESGTRKFKAGEVLWEIPGFKCVSGNTFEINPSGDTLVLPMSDSKNKLAISVSIPVWDSEMTKIIDSVGKMFEIISGNYKMVKGIESGVNFISFTSK